MSADRGPAQISPNQDSAMRPLVVVLDSDPHAAEALAAAARDLGCQVDFARTTDSACDLAWRAPSAVVVADAQSIDGRLEILAERLHASHRGVALLVTASDVTVRAVLRWVRAGAADVLPKPFVRDEVRQALERAAMRAAMASEGHGLRGRQHARASIHSSGLSAIVGSDAKMHRALELADAAGAVRSTVLIEGESGTGKSMLARAIHAASDRRDRPFVELACGSIPDALLESELFGHVRGAFTGAIADKKGRFLAAHGGTIFLDEINSAPLAMQLKLLRVLQEKRFEPVGSEESIDVDVRVIVAANQPLEALVREGRFREDLFYRVHVLTIDLPPLRERPDDIESLAEHFLRMKSADANRTLLGFTPEAMSAMRAHRWPGNVRELENAIERATILCQGARIDVGDLPERVLCLEKPEGQRDRVQSAPLSVKPQTLVDPRRVEPHTLVDPRRAANFSSSTFSDGCARSTVGNLESPSAKPEVLASSIRERERQAILAALEGHGWNRTRASIALGIDRSTLYRKMIDLGLTRHRDSA
ncbi:MAG: Transcriptional regulatory protein ZraR [Planctomycetota bacterium]